MAKRGDNIHKRKDGRWEGRYKDGFKTDGTIKYSSVYAHSYTECKQKLNNAISCKFTVQAQKTSEIYFSDLLFKWLFSNQIRLKGSTEAKYRYLIESHILPELGGIKLSQLNSSIINGFLDKQLNHGGIKNKGALAPSYVKSMAVIIEATINYAVQEGICIPLRTPINKPVIPKKELVVLSKAAEESLMALLLSDYSKVSLGTLLALLAGLRIGEVCALRWCDIDFENNLIHIRHTISRISSPSSDQKSVLILDTPKTNSSFRSIPMPSKLREALFKAYQIKTSEYVVSDDPSFVGTRTFDYRYRKMLTRYNVQIISFHALRHTYATRCAESGMDAKTLSRLLGHSSSNTTLNIYVHPSMEVAMQQVEQIFCYA